MRQQQSIAIPAWFEGLLIGCCLSLLWVPWALVQPSDLNRNRLPFNLVDSHLPTGVHHTAIDQPSP